MTSPRFSCEYSSILSRIDAIDPVRYGKTRNFIDGDVTCLSPYISRGVISTRLVLERVLSKGCVINEIVPFIKQLAWRDYFQCTWQMRDVESDIRFPQASVTNYGIPEAIVNASTGIAGVDDAIKGLYKSGYMHNHCRMYVASIACNIAGSHWHHPARWMYYHLLDGDLASNNCSWQWIVGANSSKKYFANQENISRYTHTPHIHSYLDVPYESFMDRSIPEELKAVTTFNSNTLLPKGEIVTIDPSLPVFIYNYYHLDPAWRNEEPANRILLLEPELFRKYPVSEQCISFLIDCSRNIPGIQIYCGAFNDLINTYQLERVYYREHPLNRHYTGVCDEREWLVPEVTGYFSSFFSYWKQLAKALEINDHVRKAH